MTYEALDWDSAFFEFSIGQVSSEGDNHEGLRTAVSEADEDGVHCLYLLCPAGENGTLQYALDLGFRPYDVRLELECEVEAAPQPSPVIRDAKAADGPMLERIAREELRGTRFWNDPHFPRERVADLYAHWLHRGLSATPERHTLVGREVEGFIVCHFDNALGQGSIELIAVTSEAQGKGLAGNLVAAANHAFAAGGLSRAVVVTQASNIAAQRLYQRYGYRAARADMWLHRWRG